ncbi:MAG: phosphatase PAP2 family protein [Tannerella sp.]|nr:phosphatase PAP2 family protein [Tannerella sp.]
METAVYTVKNTTNIRRPDGSNNCSFPSGHTATAFVGAHILYREYRDVSPWICVAGYAVATGTGVLRVLNRKHWISDVITGAGIGILSAEAGYMLLPAIRNTLGITGEKSRLLVSPVIGENQYAIGLAYTF